jgi:hypothetical protein
MNSRITRQLSLMFERVRRSDGGQDTQSASDCLAFYMVGLKDAGVKGYDWEKMTAARRRAKYAHVK